MAERNLEKCPLLRAAQNKKRCKPQVSSDNSNNQADYAATPIPNIEWTLLPQPQASSELRALPVRALPKPEFHRALSTLNPKPRNISPKFRVPPWGSPVSQGQGFWGSKAGAVWVGHRKHARFSSVILGSCLGWGGWEVWGFLWVWGL